MKRNILILALGFCITAANAQSDTLLDRILIKTLPLKFLTLHPNIDVEIPLSKYVHTDLHVGIYMFHIYMGDDIFDLLLLEGTGYSASAALKFFAKSGNNKSQFYWGPFMYFRYYTGKDSNEYVPRDHTLKTISGELKLGIQNPKRTLETFGRVGVKYVFFDIEEEKIMPVLTAGFHLSLPLRK